MAQLKSSLAERALALGLVGADDLARSRAELGADAEDVRLVDHRGDGRNGGVLSVKMSLEADDFKQPLEELREYME